MIFVIILLAAFLAMNMGSASFAASFAAAHGGKILSYRKSVILFLIFVLLGALLMGENVSVTLGKGLVDPKLITHKAIVIIFFAAAMSMFIANFLHIPQSTSLAAVASICGVGVHLRQLNFDTLLYLVPFWIILPLASFLGTLFLTSIIYPPRNNNFWIYEKIINHESKLKVFVILTSCFNGFSVGTNNVANIAGPLLSLKSGSWEFLLALCAIAYGLGALTFQKTLQKISKEIVPLGLMTASIVSFVSGSLMIVASFFGVPQSFVMLQMGAIFAVSVLKEGKEITMNNPILAKTLYIWIVNPILTFLLSLGLSQWML